MIKVLLNAIALRGGGSESFLLGLLPELLKEDKELSIDLLIASDRRKLYEHLTPALRIIEVAVQRLDSAMRRLYFEHVFVPNALKTGSYHVCFRADEMVSPITLISNVPVVAVFHATAHMLIPEMLVEGSFRLAYQRLVRWAAMKSARVMVAVSRHEKDELCRLYPFAANKIEVVYHGIDRGLFKPANKSIPDQLRMLGVRKYIFCASDRYIFKNYVRLIEAFASLCRREQIEEHLVIAGRPKSPKEEDRIASAIRLSGIVDHIHVLDYIQQRELPKYYQGATAYVFPSLFESFGFTPLESMACGVPVACSRYSAIPEICGDAAEYFDPQKPDEIARAIKIVIKDKKRKASLRKLGLRRAMKFSWKTAAEKYSSIIRDVSVR